MISLARGPGPSVGGGGRPGGGDDFRKVGSVGGLPGAHSPEPILLQRVGLRSRFASHRLQASRPRQGSFPRAVTGYRGSALPGRGGWDRGNHPRLRGGSRERTVMRLRWGRRREEEGGEEGGPRTCLQKVLGASGWRRRKGAARLRAGWRGRGGGGGDGDWSPACGDTHLWPSRQPPAAAVAASVSLLSEEGLPRGRAVRWGPS